MKRFLLRCGLLGTVGALLVVALSAGPAFAKQDPVLHGACYQGVNAFLRQTKMSTGDSYHHRNLSTPRIYNGRPVLVCEKDVPAEKIPVKSVMSRLTSNTCIAAGIKVYATVPRQPSGNDFAHPRVNPTTNDSGRDHQRAYDAGVKKYKEITLKAWEDGPLAKVVASCLR